MKRQKLTAARLESKSAFVWNVRNGIGVLCREAPIGEGLFKNVQHVLRPDDETPAGPDGARAHERKVLGDGELFGGSHEVGCAGDHDAPFHYWCPVWEMGLVWFCK